MNILVTGGGGFLGRAICKQLINDHKVFSFSRNHHKSLDELSVETIKGSLHSKEDIIKALDGIDAVFHVAAIAGVWGKYEKYYSTNTLGTQNLVDACKESGIKYLIYTSTPSVVFEKEDICGADETIGYANKYLTHYAYTKSLAEKYVIDSVDDNFFALAIRPHLIWGPGDPHIIPRLVQKSKSGRLKQVGDGENLVDIIYVDNAASAHVKAFNALVENKNLSGRKYFVGQEKPVKLWSFINQLLVSSGEELVESSISFKTAYYVGWILEKIFGVIGITQPEPPMTRFVATQLAKSHYFSHANAKADFGYEPLVSIEEGLVETFKNRQESLDLRKLDT